MTGRVLVAGVGNLFLADDGFGPEVARRLRQRALPPGVVVGDFGIAGLHLAYELLEGYEILVLLDAVRRGETPGTVSVIEVDVDDLGGDGSANMDAHSMDPATVLAMAAGLGVVLGRVLLVGCEPAELDERIGLSAVVEAAVGPAVDAAEKMLAELCGEKSAAGRIRERTL